MESETEERALLWDLVRDVVLDAECGRIDIQTAQVTLEAVVEEWTRA